MAAAPVLGKVFEAPLSDEDVVALRAALAAGDPATAATVADTLRRLSVLIEVTRTVCRSLSLDDLLPRLMDVVTTVLEAERATLFLHDAETDELFSRVLQGDSVNEIRIPSAAGIAGAVFKGGETLNIADAYADPRFNPEVDRRTGYRTRTILCVPLHNKHGQVIGATQVLNRRGGPFTDEDANLLSAINAQAAAALEHARLFEQHEQVRRDEATLLEISSAISSDLDLDALLAKVMHSTTRLLDAERSTIFVHDPDTNELWSRVAEGLESKEIRFPAHAGIAGEAFTKRTVLNIPDAYADPRFNPEVDRKTGFRTRSILCMPVLNKFGQAVAVMQVLNKRGGPFGKRDEARLTAFSSQVAVALENARLFRDVVALKNYNEGILKSLSNGVVTLDGDSRITKVNEAAMRILGRSEDEMVGRPLAHVLGNANPWIVKSLQYVAETQGSDYHADAELRRDSGDEAISVNVTVTPLTDVEDQSIGTLLVIEDITREKRVRNTMSRYMAKEVVDRLLEAGEDVLTGSAQLATILFSDIRRFTTLAENLAATETVELLNTYFADMVEVVFEYGGILDKYIGDAIMAVFGAPITGEHDADNAVAVAIEMMHALRRFNAPRQAAGLEPIEIGIGVATGDVVAGNIGSERRMDYTVIGDSVNLAARLEGANKFFGTAVLISGATAEHLTSPRLLREIDLIRVKGRSQPIPVFEPLESYDDSTRAALVRGLSAYEKGLALYRQRAWAPAIERFEAALEHAPGDRPARLYRDRCRYYQKHPPNDAWNGVWTLTEK